MNDDTHLSNKKLPNTCGSFKTTDSSAYAMSRFGRGYDQKAATFSTRALSSLE
jgi:hypothetical protein